MIECTDEYIWKKKKIKKRKSKIFSLIIILTVIVSVWAYNRFVVFELIVSFCEDYAYSCSADAVNEAVMQTLSNGVEYTDIINVEKNTQGDIVLVEANTVYINKINREIVAKTTKIMSDKIGLGVPIPLFSFSGISFLTGFGPKVNFKSVSIVSVTSNFSSEFKSAGINQTIHSVFVNVDCKVDVLFPLNKKTVSCVTPILLCETVLVGNVPEVFLNGKLFS